MKNKYVKFLCAYICLICFSTGLFGGMSIVSAESSAACDDAYSFFSQLGVTGEEFEPEEIVSRGYFIYLLMRALNNPYDYVSAEHKFTDVTSEQKWFESVGKAYNLGIINGYSENSFLPNQPISAQEMDIVLRNALNVYDKSKTVNTYSVITMPSDFRKIYKNIDMSAEQLKAKDVLVVLYNMLDIERRVIFGGKYSYDTLLNSCWHLYRVTGVMEANSMTSLYEKNSRLDNKIQIDGTIYDSDKDYSEYIGYSVEAYISNDSETENNLVCLFPESGKNKVVTINSRDFDSDSFGSNRFTYSNGRKDEKIRLSSTISVIYNGSFAGAAFEKYIFDVDLGNVKFIDNGNDGTYDVAIIESFSTIMASSSMSGGENLISDYYSGGNLLKFNDYNYTNTVDIYFDGVKGKEADIVSKDLVDYYVAENDDRRYIKAYVSRNTITGTLEGIWDDNSYVINGKTLFVARRNKTPYVIDSKPSIGSYGIFRLNYLGEVAAFETTETTDLYYGILVKISKPDTWEKTDICIFTSGGAKRVFETQDRFSIDKVRYKKTENDKIRAKLSETTFSDYADSPTLLCQLIRYKLKDGKISEIFTSNSDYAESPKIGAPFETRQYLTIGNVYGSNVRDFRVSQGTKYFLLPSMKDGDIDIDEMAVTDIDSLENTRAFKCQAYNVDEFGMAEIVVFLHSYENEDYGDAPTLYLVEDVCRALNKNGDDVNRFTLFSKGSVFEYDTLDDEIGNDVHPGDLVFVAKDYNDVIRFMSVKYSLQYPRLYQGVVYGDENTYRSATRLNIGYMTAYSNGWARLTIDPEKVSSPTAKIFDGLWGIGTMSVTLYSERWERAKKIDSTSLPLYISGNLGNDYLIAIYEHYGQMQDCIIYELEER